MTRARQRNRAVGSPGVWAAALALPALFTLPGCTPVVSESAAQQTAIAQPSSITQQTSTPQQAPTTAAVPASIPVSAPDTAPDTVTSAVVTLGDATAELPACCAAVGGSTDAPPRYSRRTVAYGVPAVELIDADGLPVWFDDELRHDGPVVLQFFFTSCATICPVLAGTLQTALREVPDQVNLKVLSISIDPQHDTPDQLQSFAAQFQAGPRWRFLTGSPRAVRALQTAFDAAQQNKMEHEPLTFIRPKPDADWVRLDGLLSGAQLAQEVTLSRENPSD